ncbi:hypothetical protein KCMC57_64990 (plasmid) [Kitasatospora sp. CMC57]|uniref:Uncharacterized protein n=1 Tax=Kitasatospora sp. CMC57 TaxID=3231513 RepID=A0AB33K5Q9_9ACTN
MSSDRAEAEAVVFVQIEEATEEAAQAVQGTLRSRWATGGFEPLDPLPGDWRFGVDTARPLRGAPVVVLAPTGSGDLLVRLRSASGDGTAQLAVAQLLVESFHCTNASAEDREAGRAGDLTLRVDPEQPAGPLTAG